MTLTVGIVTTGGSPADLRSTVEGALRSAVRVSPDAEVLVVVNGRGRVPELESIGSPALRVLTFDWRNVGRARNAVLDNARHDTILFTDEDCAVAADWCAAMSAGLDDPAYAMVAGPVDVKVTGPVSAYFDYNRRYDAVPATKGGPLLVVGTNCGLRRDRLPEGLRYDASLHTAGEDTGFSLALADAGLAARWLPDAPPVRHGLSEDIDEITHRSVRNAYHGLKLYLDHGRADAALPGMLDLYRQRIADDFRMERRYGEFVAPEVRAAFSVYHSMSVAGTAVGYLRGLGDALGEPLLALDLDALYGAWREIADRVRARVAGLSGADWAGPEIDYRTMGDRLDSPDPLLDDVRRGLRAYAAPVDRELSGPMRDLLDHGLAEVTARYLDDVEASRAAYDELCAGTDLTRAALERGCRGAGVPFQVAGEAIEFTLRFEYKRMLAAWRAR